MTKFGLWIQLEHFSIEEAISIAQLAEDLQYHTVLVNDHFMKASPRLGSVTNEIPEAYITLAAIACATKKLRLGTAVTPITLRSVPQLAKMVATLDILSKGRLIFGVGAGWYQAEYEGYGSEFLPPRERVSKMIEGLTLMKRMWIEDEVSFSGSYYNVKNAVLLPKPAQKPHPPILIGSRSPRMSKIVARIGNGWIPSHLSPEQYDQRIREILAASEKKGRRREELIFAITLRIILDESREIALKSIPEHQRPSFRNFVIGSPEECAEKLREYVDVGVDLICLRLHNVERSQEQILTIRDEIIPQMGRH